MNILVITQKIDRNDGVLGFFHTWVERLSERFDKVTVICLEKGEYDLPSNVKVLSLGKEEGRNTLRYIVRFFRYIVRERKHYDVVFVHMNQEYVLMGSLVWKLLGKKIALWRNHAKGSFLTRLAVALSDIVFCTSPYSFTARFKKTKIMPAGIDERLFKIGDDIERQKNSLLFLGRISPVKRADVLIDALGILSKEGVDFEAHIYGDALPGGEGYMEKIKNEALSIESGTIEFHGSVAHRDTPSIYQKYEVFVNLTDSGSFDKTVVEASFSGALIVFSNPSFKLIDPDPFLFKEGDSADLAEKIQYAFSLSEKEKERRRSLEHWFALSHALGTLVDNLETELKAL